MTTDDAKNIKELMKTMRVRDPNLRVSGASQHKYHLGPTLTEDELTAFEQTHQVTLPADYRLFLKEIGNGCAGPSYGVPSLERVLCDCDPSQPFPFTERAEVAEFPSIKNWGDEEPYPGLIVIHDNGTFFSYLVVNGPAHGTIWETEWSVGFYPTGLSFDAWYRRWIDFLVETALPTLAREKIVEKITLGMTMTEVIEICGAVGGPWQKTDSAWSKSKRTLRFEHLATQFELAETDVLVRIRSLPIFRREVVI